ncbi:MAG: flagellar basal body rod protein FlgB [Carboxydocellales bacterium]
MIDKLISTPVMDIMQLGLDAAATKQKVMANNLANVSTPGFKASEVSFEDELKKALEGSSSLSGTVTNARHIPIGPPKGLEVRPAIHKLDKTEMRVDGNNVDIDREMALLAKNTIMYNALTQKVSGDFAKLKYVINGGR